MRARRLGTEGPEVSVVGLGCNNFGMRVDLEGTRAVVDAALDAGVTLFDTADIYGGQGGSESFLGEVLAGRRDRVVLATKFGGDMGDGTDARGSRAYIHKAIDASLARLRTDYVDLYQYHTPDNVTPFEETFGALDEVVRAGKARCVGHSNLNAAQVEEVDTICREHGFVRPVSAQNQYSLMKREAEDELLPACESLGLGVLLLAAGAVLARRKPKLPDAENEKQGLVSRMIANPAPASAFAVGLLLFAPGITFIAALQVIATANASVESTTVAIILVVIINAAFVWLPLLLHLVAPGVTTRRLTAFNGWLRANGNTILVAVLIAGGAIMIGNGIYGLAGG
jgi:aryl-alcohol dehydrogenase-like predicted oxidoreductase